MAGDASSEWSSGVRHERHKPATTLTRPRELVLALPPMRSQVNTSRIVRAAGCCGVEQVIACGHGKLDSSITRGAEQHLTIRRPRTLPPVLKELKQQGYLLVGLEQTNRSECLYSFAFPRRCVLVVGHERDGLPDSLLAVLDVTVEIPVYGFPDSHNAATAACMALYEYCRQYPEG